MTVRDRRDDDVALDGADRNQGTVDRRWLLGALGVSGATLATMRPSRAAAAEAQTDQDASTAQLIKDETSATRAALTSSGRLPVGKHELIVNAMDFGARGDGIANDTAAIQSAVNYTRTRQTPGQGGVTGGVVYLPGGEYVIDSTLDLYLFSGTLRGNGSGNSPTYRPAPGQASVLRWAGGAQPMIRVRDSRHVRIENMRLAGGSGVAPSYGINLHNLSSDQQGRNGSLHLHDLVIGEWPWEMRPLTSHPLVGIGWSGDDANNDTWTIERVIVKGCPTGIDLPNVQSIWGQISDTIILKASMVGLRTRSCLITSNIAFQECALDVHLLGAAQFDVHGLNSEHSGQICRVDSMGRLQARGGLWNLGPEMGEYFVQHDGAASNDAGITLDGVYIVNNTRRSHPKLRMSSVGRSVLPGHLTMRDVRTNMSLADLDLLVSEGGKLYVHIASAGWSIAGATIVSNTNGAAIPQQLCGSSPPERRVAAPIGSTYQRFGGLPGRQLYVKQQGGSGTRGWVLK